LSSLSWYFAFTGSWFPHNYTVNSSNHISFLTFVNRGKLCFSSNIAYEIIKFGEKVFKAELNIVEYWFYGIDQFQRENDCWNCETLRRKNPYTFSTFTFDCRHIKSIRNELHEIKIIKFIISSYAKIRLNAFAKTNFGIFGYKSNNASKIA